MKLPPDRSLEQALSSVDSSWAQLLGETRKKYFQILWTRLRAEAENQKLTPSLQLVFSAFRLPLTSVRVVILGQDPYPTTGRAVGRAFAAADDAHPIPPSLRNIFHEVARCCGGMPKSRTLNGWQEQGVLLLNVCLTTRVGESASHHRLGWQQFTDRALQLIGEKSGPVVYLLWGKQAQMKSSLIGARPGHHVLAAAHPARPYQGFPGCGHFTEANRLLTDAGMAPIDWARSS